MGTPGGSGSTEGRSRRPSAHRTWPYPRRRRFEEALREAAAAWFAARGHQTHRKMRYCLADQTDWPKISCSETETNAPLNALAVVASMAWYDYSGIDRLHAAVDDRTIARRKHEFNNDARFVTWPWDDVEMARKLRAAVERRLTELQQDPAVERIIVATHVPIFDEEMLRKPGDADWGFSNAYFGHLRLGAVVSRYSKVTDVVSGHTHAERDEVVKRAGMPPIRVRVNGGSYGNPSWILVR